MLISARLAPAVRGAKMEGGVPGEIRHRSRRLSCRRLSRFLGALRRRLVLIVHRARDHCRFGDADRIELGRALARMAMPVTGADPRAASSFGLAKVSEALEDRAVSHHAERGACEEGG